MSKKTMSILLLIIVCAMPLIYVPKSMWQVVHPNFIKSIVIVLISIFLIFLCYKNKFVKLDYIDKILMLFLLLNIISLVFSIDILSSIFGLVKYNRYDGVIILSCYLIIYYCSKYYLVYIKNSLSLILISGLFLALFGLYQYFSFVQIDPNAIFTESIFSSTIGNSNFVGSYLLLFIPALVTLYFIKGKLIYLLSSYIFLVSLLCSTARSAWIGCLFFIALFIIYLIINRKTINKRRYIIFIFPIILLFYLAIYFQKITGNYVIMVKFNDLLSDLQNIIFATSNDVGNGRMTIWKMAIDIIKKRPFLGSGPETIPSALIKYSPTSFYAWADKTKTVVDKAHNEFLQIAACVGIPALFTYITFLFCALKNNIKNMFSNPISFIFAATIISYIIQSLFNISVISVAPLFWFILGVSQNKKIKEKLLELLYLN